jgi:uncharacterized membrane protein (DUF2068 family)
LNINGERITFFFADMSVPQIGFYFPEESVTFHHPGTTRFMVLKVNELAITVALRQVGDILREYVSMNIDFEQWRNL